MIAEINRLIDAVEQDLAQDLDVAEFVARIGTTEYHARRIFSSLAGMPATPSWDAHTEFVAPIPPVP